MRGLADVIFERDGSRFVPTELARGPWDPGALHGGAPAALLARAAEQFEPREEMRVTRLTYEFARPVPLAPLTLAVGRVRSGRRAELVQATLVAQEVQLCRLTALRLRATPDPLPLEPAGPTLEDPQAGRPVVFGLAPEGDISFAASAMEMRFLEGGTQLGPARVWMRLRAALLEGEQPSGVQRAVAAADFGNGVSAVLDFSQYTFVNADLTVYLHRSPQGEWVALDSRTWISPADRATSQSTLHDACGPIGHALQGLVVERRPQTRP